MVMETVDYALRAWSGGLSNAALGALALLCSLLLDLLDQKPGGFRTISQLKLLV